MCGVQSQLLGAAELALWARIEGIERGNLERFLFRDKSLFRTWSMRGTLHLLPSSQFQMYVGALKTRIGYRKGAWLRYFGVTLEEIDRIVASIGEVLSSGALTRKELAERISRKEGLHIKDKLLSGWGEFLKPAAYNGLLACGPDREGEATFVRGDKWLGTRPDQDSIESLKNVLRHYLGSYGPARYEDFARWWGTQPAPAKRLFKSIEDELEEVDVEGHKGWMMKGDVEALANAGEESQVRLLPNFDSYVLGFQPRDSFVAKEKSNLVFRPQAWISPVLLVDGKIAGIWEPPNKDGRSVLRIRMFTRLTRSQEEALKHEIHDLSDYFGIKLNPILSRT